MDPQLTFVCSNTSPSSSAFGSHSCTSAASSASSEPLNFASAAHSLLRSLPSS